MTFLSATWRRLRTLITPRWERWDSTEAEVLKFADGLSAPKAPRWPDWLAWETAARTTVPPPLSSVRAVSHTYVGRHRQVGRRDPWQDALLTPTQFLRIVPAAAELEAELVCVRTEG